MTIEEKIQDIKHRAVAKFKDDHDHGDLAIYDVIREMSELMVHNAIEREEGFWNSIKFNLDEIDNKPWRVFRQLAELFEKDNDPIAETYRDYEKFYANGGGREVEKLIEDFKRVQPDKDITS